jgi:RNA polymerase sigma-70 factor (ECF subfamily)
MFLAMLAAIEDEGERLKITDIYERHNQICFAAAMKITKSKELAEDAVSETFVEVIKQKEKFLSLSCNLLPSYLVVIVKSRAIDILRKYKKIDPAPIDEAGSELETQELPVDEQVFSRVGFEHLVALVKGLDEKYKSVFEMKYFLNLSIKEISERLGITEENVKVRLHRGREKLKKMLESEVKQNVRND